MNRKQRVGIIYGGKSAEHEVSLQSAKNIIHALDREKYELVPIFISKDGQWFLDRDTEYLQQSTSEDADRGITPDIKLALTPGCENNQFIETTPAQSARTIDVAFPVLHGTLGEDGSVQGSLKLANIPFVGASVLGSAVGMDKDVCKRLLRDAGIPNADFISMTRQDTIKFADAIEKLGSPLFIKPANMGSSVGISKAETEQEYKAALDDAFLYDSKIIVESFIDGREIECAILGNEELKASLPGEIMPSHDFYSYTAKYIDSEGARLEIPAKLTQETTLRIQETAIQVARVLCCEGMARVDFFLTADDTLYVNEINTIPGFTQISMYPKLWEISGLSYSFLLDKLIDLALKRHKRDSALKTQY